LKELQAAADYSLEYTTPWYVREGKLFQYGDNLIWDNDLGRYIYSVLDDSKRIVKYLSVMGNPNGGGVIIKAAKESSGPVKLDNTEKTAFQGYWDLLAIVGHPVLVISEDADLLHLEASITYDGINPQNDIDTAVKAAIKSHLSNLNFGGKFITSDLIVAVKNVTGIKDIQISILEAKPAVGYPYTYVNGAYLAYSGYMILDNANLNLTYTI
jgi:hypothetical protein